MAPVSMVANLAVPAMLLAFGVSLRLGQRPGRAIGRVVTLALLKIVAMPFAALLIGVAMGLGGHELFSVVVMAALPTAQNIFTYSLRYDRAVYLTRDTIFVTTMATVPAILLVTVLFHA
jgi:malonate transporter